MQYAKDLVSDHIGYTFSTLHPDVIEEIEHIIAAAIIASEIDESIYADAIKHFIPKQNLLSSDSIQSRYGIIVEEGRIIYNPYKMGLTFIDETITKDIDAKTRTISP